jgi:glycosyltransferase involved in cell wall biosynthesis
MNIGVLTSLYPSAVRPHEGIFAARRWRGMRERGHEVFLVHPLPHAPPAFVADWLGQTMWSEIARMADSEQRDGISIVRPRYVHLPARALGNARAFARAGVRRLLARGKLDLVVLDYAWPAALSVPALAKARIPVLINGRGSDVLQVAEQPALAAELGAALREAGAWCAVSQDLVEAMDRLAGRPGQGVLVPNGVDSSTFRPHERGPARARLGLEPDGELVLVVGHLIARKDPLLALESFARAAPSAARIAFVGSGALERDLRERARQLGLGARVHFAGAQSPQALVDWYAAADVLLLTSSREGRPNVVLEALASGRPVVATDAGGTKELLHKLPGALVGERTSAAIGAALAAMLSRPPTAQQCRDLILELSWEHSLATLERCLEQRLEKQVPR